MTNEFLAFAPISAAADAAADSADAVPAAETRAVPSSGAAAEARAVPSSDAAAEARALRSSGATAAARALLDEMMARVGVDGLVAAHADPGLLAQVDQHAAAVREALAHAGRATDEAGLASYAKSIAAAAERMGRPVPQPGHAYVSGSAWLAAEWHLLRLVAVCMIAESSGLL